MSFDEMLEVHEWFFPGNEGIPIPEGHYRMNQIVDLLRKHKNEPNVIQYIADMLEI